MEKRILAVGDYARVGTHNINDDASRTLAELNWKIFSNRCLSKRVLILT